MIILFSHQVVRLIVNTKLDIDWSEFPNLQSVILKQTTWLQSNELGRESMPNLVSLVLLPISGIEPSSYLAYRVFSNWFPSLRHINLGSIQFPYGRSWSQSPSLRSVFVTCSDPILLLLIPTSCPNLHRFEIIIQLNILLDTGAGPSQTESEHNLTPIHIYVDKRYKGKTLTEQQRADLIR
ncbi:unnamed protein product [Rotaria sp. Silwood1]|nr:unnamed protein product [Rotaria sp. Silwood1]